MTELNGHLVVFVRPDAARVRTSVRDPAGHDVDQLFSVDLLVAASDSAHGSDPGPLPDLTHAEQVVVDAKISTLLVAPCELSLDPKPAQLAKPVPGWLVVHQRHDRLGVLAHVVGPGIYRRIARRHSGLAQVERDHGKLVG